MLKIFNHSLMITGFVFVMMLVIEYVNVLSSGEWQQRLTQRKWGQYILAALLGAVPGCLGAFIVVAMYSHRILTVGAVVAAMIATCGDESFVMLAVIPKDALYIHALLFVLGIIAGAVTDVIFREKVSLHPEGCNELKVHIDENCNCFPRGQIIQQWKEYSTFRGILTVGLLVFIVAIITGQMGPSTWNWIKITILFVSVISLFIVITVPEHFLEEHLWKHVAKKHIPRIFLWTFGALILMHVLVDYLHLEGMIREGKWIVLLIACLVGIIPESGPHLIFVTLYAQGTIPFSILLASSIVQDGHGMLPMLAQSRRAFIFIKLINLVVGLVVGIIFMELGG